MGVEEVHDGKRKIILANALLLALTVMFLGGIARAGDQFPTQPVNIYVGFPPGGVAGNSARAIGTPAAEFLGQPTVILHKQGAGGTLAIDYFDFVKITFDFLAEKW